MADLDDFFAKKDRKKTKGQKFATSDNMATSQEELQKKQDKQKKERVLIQSLHSSENDSSIAKLEEEWNDYSEEVKDYTTLKIQSLTIDNSSNYSDNNDKDEEIEYEENEAGEMVPKRKNAGPWKVTEPEPAAPVKVENKKAAYVPPGQRNQVTRSAPRMKTSLDVKNEDMFPVLQQGTSSSKKTVAPTAKKVETHAWAKYQ